MQDINIGVLDPKDYDVNFYSDTYIVNTSFWKTEMGEKNPILGKFLRAAAKGWNYTKENPEEAIDIMFEQIRNKIKNENTYKKELLSLRKAIEFIGDGDQNIPGYMREEIWLDMEKDLHDINRISQIGYITDLCDFDIINVLNE